MPCTLTPSPYSIKPKTFATCFLFVPDKVEYTEKTGFYVGPDEWPFEQADTVDGLLECIRRYEASHNNNRIREHLQMLGSYEEGGSCERLAQIIEKERRSN